jgi:phage shock protein A
MALITRLSRLFHADMNAVLDKIEEPELLLKQSIREMEETFALDERKIKSLGFEQQQLTHKEDEIKQSLAELEQKLVICFESDKDDLAHSLIKRKLETEHYLKSLTAQISHSIENITQLKTQHKEHQDQLVSMKQKAEIFNHNDTTETTVSNWNNPSFTVRNEDVEVAFLHEKQKWSQL